MNSDNSEFNRDNDSQGNGMSLRCLSTDFLKKGSNPLFLIIIQFKMKDELLVDLFKAYFSARKNKRNTFSALEFELNYEKELFKLYDELKNGNYEISKCTVFIVFDPVQREIIASSFRDRIIHHLIFNYINPIFEKSFIYDSYSCRKNKGTHFGINRVNKFCKSCSDNYKKETYVLKLDISGYFMNINKIILWQKIEEFLFKNRKKCNFDFNLTIFLIQKVIFHSYIKDYTIRGSLKDWQGLPKNKSLFFSKINCGLPIGNLTSQLFSNIYLNDFDHYIKKDLKVRYYGRYVDDFLLFDNNKIILKDRFIRIKEYLNNNLNLQLNNKKIYLQNINKGVKFLGVIIKPYRVYIINRIKNNSYNKAINVNFFLKNNYLEKSKDDIILSRINSYLGMLSHYNTFNLRKKFLTTKFNFIFYSLYKISDGKNCNYYKIIKI